MFLPQGLRGPVWQWNTCQLLWRCAVGWFSSIVLSNIACTIAVILIDIYVCRWIFNWFPIFPFARSLMAITTVQQVVMMRMMMMMMMMMMMIDIIITRQTTFATLESSVTHCWSFARTSSRFHRWSIFTIMMHFGDNFGTTPHWRRAKSSEESNWWF